MQRPTLAVPTQWLASQEDLALLLVRLLVGAFLVWGVADNIVSTEDMRRFEVFLQRHGFPAPAFMARLSVWAQFLVGISFLAGLGTRWAGLVCAINFTVAVWMVDRHGGIRAAFPAALLTVLGLYLACRGGGRYALDQRWFPAVR